MTSRTRDLIGELAFIFVATSVLCVGAWYAGWRDVILALGGAAGAGAAQAFRTWWAARTFPSGVTITEAAPSRPLASIPSEVVATTEFCPRCGLTHGELPDYLED